jgi:hypothetical protein
MSTAAIRNTRCRGMRAIPRRQRGRAGWLMLAGVALLAAMMLANRRGTPAVALPQTGSDCPVPSGGGGGSGERFQSPLPGDTPTLRRGEFTLQPLAGFDITARVLAREDYRFDAGAAISPVDFALGWDRMADPAVHVPLNIRQSGRWYRYTWGPEGPPIPADEIVRSSANMHMIPGTPAVADALQRVGEGQWLRLRGWLVQANGPGGYVWRSSLTRTDSGDGACEVVLVCAVETPTAAR